MSEWLKEHAWKACVGETLPWVRIPLSPPAFAPWNLWSDGWQARLTRSLSAVAPEERRWTTRQLRESPQDSLPVTVDQFKISTRSLEDPVAIITLRKTAGCLSAWTRSRALSSGAARSVRAWRDKPVRPEVGAPVWREAHFRFVRGTCQTPTLMTHCARCQDEVIASQVRCSHEDVVWTCPDSLGAQRHSGLLPESSRDIPRAVEEGQQWRHSVCSRDERPRDDRHHRGGFTGVDCAAR
jgi:hypothetical protein